MGAALALALLTLLAAVAATFLLRRIHTDPAVRETRLYETSREHDATVQESVEETPFGPAWLRLNLRDGHHIRAVSRSGEPGVYLVELSTDADPSSVPSGQGFEGLLFEARRRVENGKMEEAIALSDATGRIGAFVPTAERRLGLPWEWRIHLAQTVYHLRGRRLHREERPVATLIPGPFPRIAYVSFEAGTPLDEQITSGALLLLLRWTEWSIRRGRLHEAEA